MKKNFCILFCLFLLSGCSIPTSARYNELSIFTREEKKAKGGFTKRNIEIIKDFRQNEMYPEDITGLQEEVEKFITDHPGLNEERKTSLRALKVTKGASKEEVELLLGEADKISNRGDVWIYRINRVRALTIFIFPVFFAHEGYYLRFSNDQLVSIERHYPKQIIRQASGPGLSQPK